jgi:hypothetical protein
MNSGSFNRHFIDRLLTRDSQGNGRDGPLDEISLDVASRWLPLTAARSPARVRTSEFKP